MAEFSIDPAASIGAVALSVADLRRSVAYYTHNIGLVLLEERAGEALLGVGQRGLLRLREQPGARLVRRATGLYHFALLLPSRLELARILRQLADSQTALDGASDHKVSEALYLSDPDGHGIEIYRDRPRTAWYEGERFRMTTDPLDINGLLGELAHDTGPWAGLHPDTVMGHIHLQVADVAATRSFYTGALGFGHMTDYPGATFLSAGGYHHHLGLNMWHSAGAPPPPAAAARLLWYEVRLPGAAALAAVVGQAMATGAALTSHPEGQLVRDPSGNTILLRAGP